MELAIDGNTNLNKMKKIYYIFLILLLNSCSYILELKMDGDIIESEIDLPVFDTIVLESSCNIIFDESNTDIIRMEGIDFIIDNYIFTTDSNRLKIKHNKETHLQEKRVGNIYLSSKNIKHIIINAPCKLKSNDTIYFNNLNITINSRGGYAETDINLMGNKLQYYAFGKANQSLNRLSGEVKELRTTIEGAAKLYGNDLKTDKINISQKSLSDVYLNVSNNLDAKIYSSGNIYYIGKPEINFEKVETQIFNSSGKVVENN